VTTRSAAQRRAIAQARERREAERAALVAEIDRVVRVIGWSRARPVIADMLAPCPVVGPRSRAGAAGTGSVALGASWQHWKPCQPREHWGPRGQR